MPKPDRIAAWLGGMVLAIGALLGGCQSPQQALHALASQQGARLETLQTEPFALMLGAPAGALQAAQLRVYLEGDGRAWATASQPSLDPSPRNLLVAGLAFSDPAPSVYLARPCQFVMVDGCNTKLWTDRRFSEEVVRSLDAALDRIKARYGNQTFELVGYSGGGALALLLAARRADVVQVQTLAGNLSPRQWVALQNLSPLTGSLEPLDARNRLATIPQRHLAGQEDRIVPPALLAHYRSALGSATCLESAVLPGVSHAEGWAETWSLWRERPLHCQPAP